MADFSVSPYFDDFDENAKFLKVLFRPGYAVQTRELNQAQTILQNQITRFGNHIFKDGAMVIPGNIGSDIVGYVKLNANSSLGETTAAIIDQLDGTIITGQTSGVKALVLTHSLEENSDPNTIFVKYLNSGTSGETVFSNGENIVNDTEFPVTLTIAGSSATGFGTIATVQNGIYYIKGNFVLVSKQIIILEKYNTIPSYKIGLKVVEEIVTPELDNSLYDNAIGSPNQSAPGAHRFKIQATLVKLALDSTNDSDFIELLRLKENVVQVMVNKTDYSELEKTFARRTYDESGDYVVNGFGIELKEDRSNDRGTRLSSTPYLIGDIITVNDNTYVAKNSGTSASTAPTFTTSFTPITDGTVNWQYTTSPQYNGGIFASGDESKFIAAISPGKAYVKGFELEKFNTSYLKIDKSRTFNRSNSTVIGTTVGNYIRVKNVFSIPDLLGINFPIISLYDTVISTSGTASGTKVGEARVRWLEKDDVTNDYKLYLFNIAMNTGKNFERNVKSVYYNNTTLTQDFTADIVPDLVQISGSVSSSATAVTGIGTKFLTEVLVDDYIAFGSSSIIGKVQSVTNNNAIVTVTSQSATNVPVYMVYNTLYEPENSKLVFPFPDEYVRMVRGSDDLAYSDTVFNKTKYYAHIQASGTTLVLSVDNGSTDTFLPLTAQNYTIINDNTGVISTTHGWSLNGASTQLTITGLTSNNFYTVLTSVRQKGLQEKTKSLVLETLDFTTSDSVNVSNILLKPDVYQVLSIKQAPAFGTINGANDAVLDITSNFMMDTGQKDTHYDRGSVYLKSNSPKPTGSIRIVYEYFTHSAGDYFTVDSYKNAIPYNGIPEILRDSVDFRPRIENDGLNFNIPDIGIPKRGYTFEADYSYYIPKWVNIELDMYGNFVTNEGVPELEAIQPALSQNGMLMGQLFVHPYTLFANALSIDVTPIDNKRYTMRDIGKLEKRISNVEYYTSLSLLEQETKSMAILDEYGLDRYKNGFLVDSFDGHGIGNITSIDYRCAIDASNHVLRPQFEINNIDLVEYNQRLTNNYQVTGDIITLPYIDQEFIVQKSASRIENVNPFAVFTFIGAMELKPSTDNWFEINQAADIVISTEGNYNTMLAQGNFGTSWESWKTAWTGVISSSTENVKIDLRKKGGGKKGYKAFNEKYGKGKFVKDEAGGFHAGPHSDYKYGIRKVSLQTTATQTGLSRTGLKTSLVAKIDTQEVDNKLISSSVIPYMRSRNIMIFSRGLKPSTTFHAFFDGIVVDEYITPASTISIESLPGFSSVFDYKTNVANDVSNPARFFGGNIDTSLTSGDVIVGQSSGASAIVAYHHNGVSNIIYMVNVKGTFQIGETIVGSVSKSRAKISSISTKTIGTNLTSSESGDVIGTFSIPNNSKLKFKTGDHEFKLTTSATNGTDSTSQARAGFSATGIVQTNQKTIVSTRNAEIVQEIVTEDKTITETSSKVISDSGWYDPLAQSFYVRQNGGAFLTKIDVWFASKDSTIPVQLELREMINGYPGKKVLPGSRVILLPDEVNISANTVTLENGNIYNAPDEITTFTFSAPVYVADNTEYCFVLLSDSNSYNVWISQLGDKIVGSDRYISEQPYAGVLFKSQNASTWTANQDQDLTFVIHRAKFDTGVIGNIKFNNISNTVTSLPGNNFQTLASSTLVRIWQPNHGHADGESVVISGITGTKNGIAAANINGTRIVSNVDINSYTITAGAAATVSGFFADTGAMVSRNIRYEKLKPNIGYLNFPETSIDFNIKTTNVGAGLDSTYTKISGTDDTTFDSEKYVKSDVNESGTKSFEVVVNLSTSNDSISPVIDTHRLSVMAIGNIIDNVNSSNFIKTNLDKRTLASGTVFSVDSATSRLTTSDANTQTKFKTASIGKYVTLSGFTAGNVANNGTFKIVDVDLVSGTYIKIDATGVVLVSVSQAGSILDIFDYYISEDAGIGGNAVAKYLTKSVEFENSCTNFNIYFSYTLPSYCDIEVYYKIVPDNSSANVDLIPYTLLSPENPLVKSDDGLMRDVKYSKTVGEFTSIITKIVLKSSNRAYVPMIGDFRFIGCA